jgi:histidinol-phosphate aminotransferase
MTVAWLARRHGGTDARGPVRWDFSTCSHAGGPCPTALAAVRAADATRYPDPQSTALRGRLAAFHDVSPSRVLFAASASEFIQRLTAVGARLRPGAIGVPRHAYGDYAAAAIAWGRAVVLHENEHAPHDNQPDPPTLRWFADPSSPAGQDTAPPARPGAVPTVLDAVYAPLRLAGASPWQRADLDAVFVLHSPNKALGLTGIRGAYAIAPRAGHDDRTQRLGYDVGTWCRALNVAAPSWPLSAQAEAMLTSWADEDTQAWCRDGLPRLAAWHQALRDLLRSRGFVLEPSVTPFGLARPPRALEAAQADAVLHAHGVKVRDTSSFGLPGAWRLCAQPPEALAALGRALDALGLPHTAGAIATATEPATPVAR